MINENPYVVCFGEVLWDIFPEGTRAGGAPFNAAYNVYKMGTDVKMLSRIGNDELGKKLTDQIKGWGLTTEYIQVDNEHPTSTVIAKIDEHNEATYDIVNHVAWDYIDFLPEHKELISNAEAFIFGSLSARNPKSKETLLKLIEFAKLKIFDVNFRPPFIDIDLIKELLHKADIVKMNKAEMRQIMEFLSEEYISEDESVTFIQNHFNIKEIVLTKGSKGARYFVGDRNYGFGAVPIKIADTVGSGDAFLAGFISKRIQEKSPEEIMKEAISLGAFITSKSGACPDYEYEEFQKFKN
ncbi:carbohydrate kinase family protein [Chryseobacterium sp. G0201]|uniref:carbohydrate kinase family protein n=1 Tax=Chryseobacterium sp. G0201 TaxID=2487065 RepID=UPI000F5067E9|nr:carbohydrate kinase [Chryseobacterium sp. G0201]AZA54754.1 carbohydrate kinase [Chryseobacterium sp. G0201]